MIDNLLNALEEYVTAKHQHDKEKEKEKCQYDWSYFGYDEIKRKDDAKEEVKKFLINLIDERIEEKLKGV